MELSSINEVCLVQVSSCCTVSKRDDPYWTSRKNSLDVIELSGIHKDRLVQVSFHTNTGNVCTLEPLLFKKKGAPTRMTLFEKNMAFKRF